MFETYILPVIAFLVMGLLAGVLLTVASKFFEVKTDERIEKINDVLPQANCGSCGFAGCGDYADAIITKNAPCNLCRPGGKDTADKIADITGSEAGEVEALKAFVQCSGDCSKNAKIFDFTGVKSCSGIKRFYSGNGACAYGCLGFGDCANVCTENAITVTDKIASVNRIKCIGCGKCRDVCPNHIIDLIPEKTQYAVKCSSKDNGKQTKLNCQNGCIGCKLCEKNCQSEAITVTDFHASIDYNKCTGCASCIEKCPVNAIIKIQ